MNHHGLLTRLIADATHNYDRAKTAYAEAMAFHKAERNTVSMKRAKTAMVELNKATEVVMFISRSLNAK